MRLYQFNKLKVKTLKEYRCSRPLNPIKFKSFSSKGIQLEPLIGEVKLPYKITFIFNSFGKQKEYQISEDITCDNDGIICWPSNFDFKSFERDLNLNRRF